jgi:hypothetical protein
MGSVGPQMTDEKAVELGGVDFTLGCVVLAQNEMMEPFSYEVNFGVLDDCDNSFDSTTVIPTLYYNRYTHSTASELV